MKPSELFQQIKDWDNEITDDAIERLAWVLTMDMEAHDAFTKYVNFKRKEYRADREANS